MQLVKGTHEIHLTYPRAIINSNKSHALEFNNPHIDYKMEICEKGRDHIFSYRINVKSPYVVRDSLPDYIKDLEEIVNNIYVQIPLNITDFTWLRCQCPQGAMDWVRKIFSENNENFWYYVIVGTVIGQLLYRLVK